MKEIDFETLPDDPEMAFVQLAEAAESHLDAALERLDTNQDMIPYLVEYMNNVAASGAALSIGAYADWVPPPSNYAYEEYTNFSLNVKRQIISIKIRNARVGKLYSVALDSATKSKIHHYIKQIREIIEKSDLSDRKRNALFHKLTLFGAEVDRTRTKYDIAMLVVSDLTDAAKRGTEVLKPITELVNSITSLMAQAKSEEPDQGQLPKPEERKRIEGPKDRTAESLDDEIPF